MRCSSCTHENRDAAKFCEECAAPLARRCGSCGAALRANAKFCDECAAPTGAAEERDRADDAVARKVVTIVFADLVGSTALHERLDAESARHLMDRYYGALRGAVGAHRGTVVKLLGDGVMAAFGVPRVAEDDAIRAVRAAVDMQRAFRDLARERSDVMDEVGLRVAVNTGEVVVSADHADIVGDPVNIAARLQQEARDGDVVIGEATRRLVGGVVTLVPLGAFTLKGRSETVAAYRVVSLERPAGAPATEFVGRDDELRRLMAVYDAAVAARRARLAVILGSPGLGKSRLIDEVARRLGDGTTMLTAHCDATGGATFAPIAKALRACLRIDDGVSGEALRAAIAAAVPGDAVERARIADGIAALLSGTPASPEETFFVVRRLLAALATVQPVVLAIDDLQWAAPLLLDLTEHLIQWSTDVPLLVLVAARPELRDTRSSLVVPGGVVHEVVTLAGLDAGAATRLAANVVGADELPAAVAGRVLATSEGNPLFVGELVRMLVLDGALKREGDRWTAGVELAALEMPPTIQALLAARIERLRPEERTVLERAAVIGRQFSRAAVSQLLPREIADLDRQLEALRRSELIEPDTGWFLGEPLLRFHHGLIRDAAYRRLLKNTRAELHGRFADWVESRVGEAVEHDETIGWHLEQAHQHLKELGAIDEHGRALGERAARYLAAAGRRALARDDLPLAASLLGRALDRLDDADPARADLALDWCEALLAAGDVGPAAGAIDELGRFIGGSDRLRAWHTCFAGERAALTDPQALRATADAVAAAAEELASAGDAPGEAKAHSVHALALARLGKVGACEAALDRALAAARRGHDRRRANAVLAGAPLAALWGPSPVTRASGRCLDVVRVLRITHGAPAVEAVALRCQGVLEALRGRSEAARRMIASSRHMVEELGITHRLLEAEMFAGLIELIEGDAAAAERSLRAAYDGLRDHGLGIDAAQAAALLGRAVLALGRAAEAEALSHESEALAGDDLKAAIAWRGVRAEALARRGEHAAAVDFARAAVDLAAATDALLDHADARLALAAALRAAGRSDEADTEEARATELWDAKGATLLAERARGGGGRVSQSDQAPDDRGESVRPVRRRVRANAATANAARYDAAVAARDAGAFGTLIADDMEAVHHPTGATYDRRGSLTTFHSLLRAEDLTFAHAPLATLGDSLALCRVSWSGSGASGGTFDFGAYENETIGLVEVDAQGRRRRSEIFAANRLGNAVVRLYERYAELLPDSPARALAAATARSVATVFGPGGDRDRLATAFAPAFEAVDHRILGTWSARGAEAFLRGIDALLDLSEDFTLRIDDILDLRSNVVLVRATTSGTDRASGGPFENTSLMLVAFGSDGLVWRWEWLDDDRDAEALARFDELTAEPAAARLATAPARTAERYGRRVRSNAVTAHAARLDAAVAAGDADAFPTLLADEYEVVDHTTGTTWDRQGELSSYRALRGAQDPTFLHEPLATLGDSLALCRLSRSASGFVGRKFDVGALETEVINLIEVDAQGRRRRVEVFATDRLGDAVARLYERYADLLPDGPARARAAATARSLAAYVGPFDLDRFATALAPAIESVDHRILGTWSARGAGALLKHYRSMLDLADDTAFHEDEILSLQSNAFLVRRTFSGTDRAGGGAFERQFIQLWIFGSDGLIARLEYFDADRDAEAVARFDELTAEPAAARIAAAPFRAAEKHQRRARANAATAYAARVDAVVAARDANALPSLLADESETVDHTTGTTWDRRGLLVTWRSLLSARDPTCRHEPLATLGDSLLLSRTSMSASGFAGGTFDVGAYEKEAIYLIEVDAQGRRRRAELFGADRLGDAVARLYERYADLLPNGPARARAAATARSVAAIVGGGPVDLDRAATALAPAVEFVDHRPLGFPPTSGTEAYLRRVGTLREISDDSILRADDVLGLRSDALLVRSTNSGTDRVGSGAFERHFLMLWGFGTHGLVTCHEMFDVARDAEALARFDQLTAAPAAARFAAAPARVEEKPARRVRPNAATAQAARLDAAIAARDADALPTLLADESEVVDHTTGTTYDRWGDLASWRSLLRARDPTCRHEPLATLGDALALCRVSMSATGFAGGKFDVGAYEREQIHLVEVDAQARRRRAEAFAVDRLGDAVARLYERYADLLPDGPARARAAATARAVAAMLGASFDPDRYATAFAPAIESVDHRTLGTFSAHGADALLLGLRSWSDLVADAIMRADEILSLQPDVLLLRCNFSGIDRTGGGALERPFIWLLVFGSDGLLTRFEQFDADRAAEALARFDELAAAPPPTRFANAARRSVEESDRAMDRHDWDALVALVTPGCVFDDRRSLMRTRVEGEAYFAHLRIMFEHMTGRSRHLLATRGDRLALERSQYTSSARHGGLAEFEMLNVTEVNADGRRVATVSFDLDDLDAAHAELDDRYAAGEGAPYAELLTNLRVFRQASVARDWDTVARLLPDDFTLVSHRRFTSTWSPVDRDRYLATRGAVDDLGLRGDFRVDHQLRISARAALDVVTWYGTLDGGDFENPFVAVYTHDGSRRHALEIFDVDQLDTALARYEELSTASIAAARIANGVTRWSARFSDAWATRSWEDIAALYPPGFRLIDRRSWAHLELDRDQQLESLRLRFQMRSCRYTVEVLATRGDRLDLSRSHFELADGDIGPSETESLSVVELDERGKAMVLVAFDPDDVDAAYAELDQRYAAGEAAASGRVSATMQAFVRAFASRDWDALGAEFAPDLVVNDHRLLGWETLHGPAAYVEALRSLLDLAPDAELRLDDVRMSDRGLLWVAAWRGTHEGGAFEVPWIVVSEHDSSGKVRRFDQYDLDRLDEARARFDAIGASAARDPLAALARPNAATNPVRIPPNAAWRVHDRVSEAFVAFPRKTGAERVDSTALRALASGDFTYEDRRRHALVAGGVEVWINSIEFMAPRMRPEARELIGTVGDRIALERIVWSGEPESGAFEIEFIRLTAIDADGRLAAWINFDLDDRRAAFAEAHARFVAGEAASTGGQAPILALGRAVTRHDWDTFRASLADDAVIRDRRALGILGTPDRDQWVESMRTLADLAPDVDLESFRILAWNRHGRVDVARIAGTMPHGGGPFENVFLRVIVTGGGRSIQHIEIFDVGDADQALARFAELCSIPRSIPHDASRVGD